MNNQKDEMITKIILGSISIALTGSIIFQYVGNPELFIKYQLGISSKAFGNLVVWILTFFIAAMYILYTVKVIPFIRKHLFVFSWLKMIGIQAAVVLGIVEEILFRQVLMDWLMNLHYSIPIQVIISAVLFGVAHGAWVLLGRDLKITLPAILSTTALGGLLAILQLVADRNIQAPIVTHIMINLFIEPWLIFSTVTGKWRDET